MQTSEKKKKREITWSLLNQNSLQGKKIQTSTRYPRRYKSSGKKKKENRLVPWSKKRERNRKGKFNNDLGGTAWTSNIGEEYGGGAGKAGGEVRFERGREGGK